MTVLLVTGGRDFRDGAALRRAILDARPSLIIHGGARGADRLASEIADVLGIPQVVYPANWTGEGRAAGAIRNQRMLDHGKPDLVLAAPGGRGTADMVRRATAEGIPVVRLGEGQMSPESKCPRVQMSFSDEIGDLI